MSLPLNFFIFITLLALCGLMLWNAIVFRKISKKPKNINLYYQLNARFNFVTSVGALFLIVFAFLGFDVKDGIIEKAEPIIDDLVNNKSKEIDSLLSNKNILKAGIYILEPIIYKKDSVYYFENLRTVDKKPLPNFTSSPKLIINSTQGIGKRIDTINSHFFKLSEPIIFNGDVVLFLEGQNKKEPVKLDIWVADYKSE